MGRCVSAGGFSLPWKTSGVLEQPKEFLQWAVPLYAKLSQEMKRKRLTYPENISHLKVMSTRRGHLLCCRSRQVHTHGA